MTDSVGDVGPEQADQRFAENMVRLRERRGLSQADLVRALRQSGWATVHQTTISRIEKGERPVRLGEARMIAEQLGVTTERMLEPVKDTGWALGLSQYSAGIERALSRIEAGGYEFARSCDLLSEVVKQVKKLGYEPAEPDPSDTREYKPMAVATELARALKLLDVDPAQVVDGGMRKWYEAGMDGRPPNFDYNFDRPIVGIPRYERDITGLGRGLEHLIPLGKSESDQGQDDEDDYGPEGE
ncbi:helix-turn-helix domain-containing protein [Nocardia sp. NPDC004750]